MTLLAWLLLGWIAASLVVSGFAAWFGWHLRRARDHRARHRPTHVHTRALWLVDRSEPSRRDTRAS